MISDEAILGVLQHGPATAASIARQIGQRSGVEVATHLIVLESKG